MEDHVSIKYYQIDSDLFIIIYSLLARCLHGRFDALHRLVDRAGLRSARSRRSKTLEIIISFLRIDPEPFLYIYIKYSFRIYLIEKC